MEVISRVRDGRSDPEHISTSYVERSNLSLRNRANSRHVAGTALRAEKSRRMALHL